MTHSGLHRVVRRRNVLRSLVVSGLGGCFGSQYAGAAQTSCACLHRLAELLLLAQEPVHRDQAGWQFLLRPARNCSLWL